MKSFSSLTICMRSVLAVGEWSFTAEPFSVDMACRLVEVFNLVEGVVNQV